MPPQWAGMKFFNVYGRNEAHKLTMRSPIARGIDDIAIGAPIRLFRSPVGPELKRDFVYIDDCIDVALWLADNPNVSGLFNVGTGNARSWADVAEALFREIGTNTGIELVDIPKSLEAQYQYFTQASLTRLREAGYAGGFMTVEEGIANHLQRLSHRH